MKSVTAIVLSKNEGEIIEDCLKSLNWVDELIVVDDCSTNNTAELARKYTQNVIIRDAQYATKGVTEQRNFAIEEAASDWVLFIDADERSTPEFADEVKNAIQDEKYSGFLLPRKNYIFGKWLEHSDWYPDYQLHLFRKGKGKFDRVVHERPEIDGEVGYLKSPYVHLNYQTLDLFLQKNLFKYSAHEATILQEENYKFSWPDLIKKPTGEFLRRFFLQNGYRDGVHGFVACAFMAMHTFTVYARVWEREGFKDISPVHFNEKIGRELTIAHKDISYWVLTTEISEEKNKLLVLILKIKRKLAKLI